MAAEHPDASQDSSFSFTTTHWSVVLTARQGESAASEAAALALEKLCRIYWYPIYGFIRWRRGCNHHEAEDLTQAFFAHLLERETLKKATPEKGKFRTFLLGVLTKFLANEADYRRTLKRGGQYQIISLDEAKAHELYEQESPDALAPEKLFDRRWAYALVDRVLERLKNEYTEQGKDSLFARLEPALTREDTKSLYAECAAELCMTEGAVKVALHRLRRRFGELLRSEVAQTVTSAEETDDELRHLLAVISN